MLEITNPSMRKAINTTMEAAERAAKNLRGGMWGPQNGSSDTGRDLINLGQEGVDCKTKTPTGNIDDVHKVLH